MASLRELLVLAVILLLSLSHIVQADDGGGDGDVKYDGTDRQCNSHSEDDNEYWTGDKCLKNDHVYNDDFYKDCSKRVCKPPRNHECCGTCSNDSGTKGVYTIPFNGQCKASSSQTTPSTKDVWCAGPSLTVKECCATATSKSAYFWQHVVLPGGCSGCGRCYIYPAGEPAGTGPKPWCVVNIANGRLDGNASTVGKSCPYGKHDPHFMGAQGTFFEFNGMPDKAFCLVTDRHLHVNMKMRGYLDTRTEGASIMKDGRAVRTWIRELGIVWDDAATGKKHTLRLAARDGKSMARDNGFLKTIEYDGQEVPLLKLGETLKKDGGLTLAFTAYEKQGGGFFDADAFSLKIEGLLDLGVTLRAAHPLLQTPDDVQVHLNVQFNKVAHTADVHGVMGQTYREGRTKRSMEYTALSSLMRRTVSADSEAGKGFLDGDVKDYVSSNVLSTDCAYTTFGGKQLPLSK